ncbi:hypothetical protein [Diaphorobacter sp. ED-3]|nr:hypothetical protein [Diaphorobacter sp. ED-3]
MNAPTPLATLATLAAAASPDTDPQETAEWRDALQALVASGGPE